MLEETERTARRVRRCAPDRWQERLRALKKARNASDNALADFAAAERAQAASMAFGRPVASVKRGDALIKSWFE